MNNSESCVSERLRCILSDIMHNSLFAPFRLVGGTNIALQYSHRESVDIDLFTDYEYGSLNFKRFEEWFKNKYKYYDSSDSGSKVGMGRTYYIGNDEKDAVKVDLMYENSKFLYPEIVVDNVRMASLTEIAVMKLNAIYYGGRKKDFWDLHFLLIDRDYNLKELIALHKKRFPYEHDNEEMMSRLKDFSKADEEPAPVCRLGKFWDRIKLDILDLLLEL
ncbi:MAG: nucleotidyl transferase AbiEii/AbiGii toxin family protein [Muribaculaceae bacterium]|nr:nucleotidyl transferase AbiEii/AbiGii toxin family protein [Muribaculaceae bacterium]